MMPVLVKLISPELELALLLFRETTPDEEPPTPPPPPMVCSNIPKLLSPLVVITPELFTVMSPERVDVPAWPAAEKLTLLPPVV